MLRLLERTRGGEMMVSRELEGWLIETKRACPPVVDEQSNDVQVAGKDRGVKRRDEKRADDQYAIYRSFDL